MSWLATVWSTQILLCRYFWDIFQYGS